MRDGPPGGSSILQRLARLEEYESTWRASNIPIREQSSGGDPESGGLFVTLDRDQHRLDIRRPASFFSGIPEKAWTVDLSELPEHGGPDMRRVRSYGYAVDIAQDLLVLMVLEDDGPDLEEYPQCYVLSLSGNGATHPLAARRQLIYDESCLDWSSVEADIEIVGDLVGCTVLGSDVCMSVHNWKTGAMLWCDSEEGTEIIENHARCHILDPTHVLKISEYDLAVYRMAAKGGSTPGRLVCNLGMPAFADAFEVFHCGSYIQRPPQTPDCSPDFECDDGVTVLAVKYEICHESRPWQDRAILVAVIPITTILAQTPGALPPSRSRPRQRFWSEWGAHGARLVLIPFNETTCSADICAFGSRVAISLSFPFSRQPGVVDVAVLDVREGVKHARDGSDAKREGTASSRLLVLDRFTEDDTPFFARSVEAKMPYRMVRTRQMNWAVAQTRVRDLSNSFRSNVSDVA
ncbi:hypothetical protein OH76DRAFT_1413662 [Lentinus brumalis]|uniref:Uncharacterized protein n=1 Tax=Lentinus brumalis TaxID=2498619 RepID=A0A371DX83_9APHY|nr:hypothetical protein OH76DRAFT_1413662 [Polyporus brumalis]